jgi:hypothetical protein
MAFTLQGCYAAYVGNCLPTFRDRLSVASSAWPLKMGQVGYHETSVNNYQHTLRNIPEEWKPQLQGGGSPKSLVHYRAHNSSSQVLVLSQSIFSRPASLSVISILSSHLRLGLPSDLYLSGVQPEILYALLMFSCLLLMLLVLLIVIWSLTVLGGQYEVCSFSLWNFPSVPLKSKYFCQLCVLTHPQFVFVVDGEQLVDALRYKPEGRGFDSRWCQWYFSLT